MGARWAWVWSRLVGLALCLLATAGPSSVAEEPDPLRRPLSPGTVALLLGGKMGPAEVKRCGEALADQRPETRAAGARVARVSGASGLVPALLQALATEKDLPAAREELMALGWLTTGPADDAMFAAATRLEGAVDRALAISVGFRGPQALSLLPRLNTLRLSELDWKAFFTWATREGREDQAKAEEAAVALQNPAAWAAVLSSHGTHVIDAAVLRRALASDSALVRERTYWEMFRSWRTGDKPDAATNAALAATPEAAAETPGDPVAAFAFELLRRRLGHAAVDRAALLQALPEMERHRLPIDGIVLAELRESEKPVYARLRFGDSAKVDEILKAYRRAQDSARGAATASAPRLSPGKSPTRVRTASDFTPGLLADVLAATGCRLPGQPAWAMLEVRHDEKGALAGVGLGPLTDLGACAAAARALLLVTAVPRDRPSRPNETDILLLPLFADFASCASAPEPEIPSTIAAAEPAAGGLREPRKTRNVSPRYPPAAIQERRQGAVIVEAIISPEGCVRAAEVVRGEHADLEGEALRAVLQWRYTPTLLNGQAVPVVFTLTVNFRLN